MHELVAELSTMYGLMVRSRACVPQLASSVCNFSGVRVTGGWSFRATETAVLGVTWMSAVLVSLRFNVRLNLDTA